MKKVWVVVANASRAKIYHALDTNTLQEKHALIHPESRQHGHDLDSDRPGRSTQKMAGPRQVAEKTPVKLYEKEQFAQELAHLLDQEHKLGSFERLYVIASDPFMSCLKHHLCEHASKCIHSVIHKDLTLADVKEIRSYLPPVL